MNYVAAVKDGNLWKCPLCRSMFGKPFKCGCGLPGHHPQQCLCCGRTIKDHPDAPGSENVPAAPDGAIVCTSTGNFGSTVYDPGPEVTGRNDHLTFYICDQCLIEYRGRICVTGRPIGPIPKEDEK